MTRRRTTRATPRAASRSQPGSVRVVTGDGATPPAGPYERIIVTAGCWSLPGGRRRGARRRRRARRAAARQRRRARARAAPRRATCCAAAARSRAASCRCAAAASGRGAGSSAAAAPRPRTPTSASRAAARSTGCWPSPAAPSPIRSRCSEGEHALDGDPVARPAGRPAALARASRPGHGRPPWTVGLHVLPASLLVLELASGYGTVAGARLHGGEAALRTCLAGMEAWRAAGSPGPAALQLTIEPHSDRTGWSLPVRRAGRRGHDGARRAPLDAALRASVKLALRAASRPRRPRTGCRCSPAPARSRRARTSAARPAAWRRCRVARPRSRGRVRAPPAPPAAPGRARGRAHPGTTYMRLISQACSSSRLTPPPATARPSSHSTTNPPPGGESSDGRALEPFGSPGS